ncbi:MAG: ABC transporter ATP-binding protein [Christensenellaceae bacterium]|nr:ABC transporter ATP-binding protein [Christensenellaceae bacterium]
MNSDLIIKNLSVNYQTDDGLVYALDQVDLLIKEGSSHGLVGETGAGKTTLAKSVMRLLPERTARVISGEVYYQGKDLLKEDMAAIRNIRGEQIAMVFQDPMTSLNPVLTVGEQIAEAIEVHGELSKSEVQQKVGEILEMVGIPADRAEEYPHQFSGGMKQRVVIAIALVCNPKVLIADEPTTALDVTIQAQVLETIKELRQKLNTSMLLITHDLGVVAQNCEHVSVMYAGEIVESASVKEIFSGMKHPYTKGLFNSIPKINVNVTRLIPISGLMPDPTQKPQGCKFADRCPQMMAICLKSKPELKEVSPEHHVRCYLYDSI